MWRIGILFTCFVNQSSVPLELVDIFPAPFLQAGMRWVELFDYLWGVDWGCCWGSVVEEAGGTAADEPLSHLNILN